MRPLLGVKFRNAYMSYFLFEGKLEVGKIEDLSGDEALHILQSRRLRVGEHFEVQDSTNQRFLATLINASRNRLTFDVQEEVNPPPPSRLRLELMQALPKEKATDWIVQKVTELGITQLILFHGRYSPKAIPFHQQEKTLQRWKKISWEACKQSGRQTPPEILWFEDIKTAFDTLPPCPSQWMTVTNGNSQATLTSLLAEEKGISQHHRVLVGAEGGLHPDEIHLAQKHGMQEMSLGPRILRAETAAIAVTAIFQFFVGDLSNT